MVIMGSTGLGSETYLAPKFMNYYVGTKFKIVKGYKGGAAINKAMEQGEVQGRMNYFTGWTTVKAYWLRDKKVLQLVQYGPRIKELPNVPRLVDLVTDPEGKKISCSSRSAKRSAWASGSIPTCRRTVSRRFARPSWIP